jgi:sulfur relay (sulfurtransferase) complex TusBCD TusD component (DsrE family)
MSKYILIESRDCFESPDANEGLNLMGKLANEGNKVTVFLVQNSVLSTRKGAKASAFSSLIKKKVKVLVDDFSLKERGIGKSELKAGIKVSNMESLVDLVMEKGTKAIWH